MKRSLITINTKSITAIKNCIGMSIFNIARVQSFFNDKENEDGFGDLEIVFKDNLYLTLSGIGDGESIKAENKEADIPIGFDISDSLFISWKLLDMKQNEKWKEMIGQTLIAIELFYHKNQISDDTLISCILYFNKDFINFYRTCSDDNKFFFNERLFFDNDDEIRIERIESKT
jgi:hypothetical protein